MGDSPRSLDPHARSLRETYLQQIADQWRWPNNLLTNFSKHRFWDVHKATEEHAIIRDQLKQCLRMIVRFAGQHVEDQDLRNNQDLRLIGRKLHAYLENRPGKIEIITTRYNVQKKEDELSLIEIDQEHAEPLWHLYCGYVANPIKEPVEPVKEAESLLEILCWIVLNGLHNSRVKIHLRSIRLIISPMQIQLILDQLQSFFTSNRKSDDEMLEAYQNPNQFLASVLFINLGETLPEQLDESQIVMSERSDPFSYGETRVSFIQRIDRITLSSWGEVTIAKYRDVEGFFHCITELINNSELPVTSDRLDVVCHTPLRAKSIVLRIKVLFSQLIKFFSQPGSHWRYVVPAKSGYYLFTRPTDGVTYHRLETNDLLLRELSATQQQFAPVFFDNHVLSNTFVPFLYAHIAANTVQIFFHRSDKRVAIYVIDEKGALYTRQHSDIGPEQILVDYFTFLQTLIDRSLVSSEIKIRIFEIQRNSAGVISCHAVKFKPKEVFPDLNVRVTTSSTINNSGPLTIYCNDRKFSSTDKENMYSAAKKHILAFRHDHANYPFHIDEIDVAPHLLGVRELEQAHSVHYLQYKQKIETRIAESRK